jgi:hypothetical protein
MAASCGKEQTLKNCHSLILPTKRRLFGLLVHAGQKSCTGSRKNKDCEHCLQIEQLFVDADDLDYEKNSELPFSSFCPAQISPIPP